MKVTFVTGGAGFIGSALVRELLKEPNNKVIVIDKLTYAGNLQSLSSVIDNDRFIFEKYDICDGESMAKLFFKHKPDLLMHLAAESHVDRSIDGPYEFIKTNIIGTYQLLDNALKYYNTLTNEKRRSFRFHHISTDEVYGDLEGESDLFYETTPYAPSSPYSASKASSDHLVRAWHRTYELPVVVTNCSNNYGPFHFPEKLIPLVILNALDGKKLPIYGDGSQIRDWLYVEDHARALIEVANKGEINETYNIGGHNEMKNIDVVRKICDILDQLEPVKNNPRLKNSGITTYSELITFVDDRPGHDKRYAIDASKIKRELGWQPLETFDSGIEKTIRWYLENQNWVENVKSGEYAKWIESQYK